MRKWFLCMFLAQLLLLTGCHKELQILNEPEPTASYEWMAGESPVSNHRIGVVRAGVNSLDHAVSPTGIYFVPPIVIDNGEYQQVSEASFILYADNGSNSFNNLCGRSDCTHDNPDCNAYLYQGSDLSYYQGKLYAVTGEGPWHKESKLIRMEPDGSRHEEILDLHEFAKKQGLEFVLCRTISDGYCFLDGYGWEEQEDGTSKEAWLATYKYKLDGSLKEPQLVEKGLDILYQCGDFLATLTYETVDGVEYLNCSRLNLETDEEIVLTEHPGGPVWFGEQEAYFFRDGAIMRLTYATQEQKVMVDTGLEGEYFCFVFPDCLVLVSNGEKTDPNLYFYNWAFEQVDTVKLDYPVPNLARQVLIAETVDKIILSDGEQDRPLYYIDKAELGTGNVQLYEYQYA